MAYKKTATPRKKTGSFDRTATPRATSSGTVVKRARNTSAGSGTRVSDVSRRAATKKIW